MGIRGKPAEAQVWIQGKVCNLGWQGPEVALEFGFDFLFLLRIGFAAGDDRQFKWIDLDHFKL